MSGKRRASTLSSQRGKIYYTPTSPIENPRLPIPPFQARERRPHSIHITRFPAGFDFFEPIRPEPPAPKRSNTANPDLERQKPKEGRKRIFTLIFSKFASKARKDISKDTLAVVNDRSTSPESDRSSTPPLVSRERTVDSYNQATARVRPATNRLSTIMTDTFAISSPAPPRGYRPKLSESPTVSTHSVDSQPETSDVSHKPVAQGNGVTVYVNLTEPYVTLTGFEHDSRRPRQTENSVAMVRGTLKLEVTKAIKIRKVYLKLSGICQTDWPEGIPPSKTVYVERESQSNKNFPYFDAKFDNCQTDYGPQCSYTPRCHNGSSSSTNLSMLGSPSASQLSLASPNRSRASTLLMPNGRETKRLSLQNVQSRSFQKGESTNAASPAQKGFTVFYPGTYEYPIEIPIDHTSAETMTLPLGFVKWDIEVFVERTGIFKTDLKGTREITVIRAPEQNSLEQSEPIAIKKNWDDQLHYEVVVSGKTFSIGETIPVAFKLTPLAKIRVHRIRVQSSEHVDYYTSDKKVARKDVRRKLILFEKIAGKPLDPKFTGCAMRFTNGGETENDEEPNLMGDLTRGEQYWGMTEFELGIKLPSCKEMAADKNKKLNPDSTHKSITVRHWLQITIRVSRLDPEDPEGKRRRQFEISIDSPYHILHCKASSAYTTLPQYTPDLVALNSQVAMCGCPDSTWVENADQTLLRAPSSGDASPMMLPARPPQAHFSSSAVNGVQRPIHLIRVPSFAPPPFDAEMAPPLMTPPPDYDNVVGTPSHDGLADYFARLSAENDMLHPDDAERTVTRTGAVNVATPGGRVISRSMEIERPFFMLRPETFNGRITPTRSLRNLD